MSRIWAAVSRSTRWPVDGHPGLADGDGHLHPVLLRPGGAAGVVPGDGAAEGLQRPPEGDLGAAGAVQEGGAVVAGEADRGGRRWSPPTAPAAPAGTAKRERNQRNGDEEGSQSLSAMGNTSKKYVFFQCIMAKAPKSSKYPGSRNIGCRKGSGGLGLLGLVQHVLGQDAVPPVGVVHQHMGHGPHRLPSWRMGEPDIPWTMPPGLLTAAGIGDPEHQVRVSGCRRRP